MTIEEIFAKLDPENKAVRNNGGGYYNHNIFWRVMGPNGGGKPSGELAAAIEKTFGTFKFKKGKFNLKNEAQIIRLIPKYGKLLINTLNLKSIELTNVSIDIHDLEKEVDSITGVPKPIQFTDKIVGLVEYRDGTIIDVIRQVKE